MATRVIDHSVTVEATTREWEIIKIAVIVNRPDIADQITKATTIWKEDEYGDGYSDGSKPADSKTQIKFSGLDADAVNKAIHALGI